MRYLEVIALDEKDVLELNDSSIDRIEFCVDIEEDGLTPSLDLVKRVLEISTKEINIMVRDSNTFILEDKEEKNMLEFISKLANLKNNYPYLSGIVLGYITQDNKLNESFLENVNEIRQNLKVTFHKASDFLINNEEVLKLKNYNIDTILTQGGKDKIENNSAIISSLKESLPNIEILLGGGINKTNIDDILKLNTSIHLGSLARIDNSYNNKYNIPLLNNLKNKM